MVLRTLQRRIVAVFVGLLVVVMALIVGLVMQRNQRIVADETARELAVGTHVFQRLIEQSQHQLETAATVLSGDFAFREAIATQDRATVHSVIRNHGLRIGAQAMMVIQPDGTLIADTQQPARQEQAFPFADLLAGAQSSGKSTGFRQMRDGKLYQIVLVPILAPRLIAWVAMGFQVDDRWAHDLSEATGLTVSVVRQQPDGAVGLLASSLDAQQRPVLEQALRGVTADATGQVLALGPEQYQARQLALGGDVAVVLLRSLEQAQAPFQSLQRVLLLVVLGGVLLFALGSVLLARRIGQPVNALAQSARRIEAGDYSQPVPALPLDEIGQLAQSFDHMRERIKSREEKILRLAYEDSLTGLANRTRFLETLGEQLQARGPGQAPACGAVVLLNIDRFASINSALGHGVGDRLLVEVGALLARLHPAPTLVARLWGDEFAFLLCGADRAAAVAFAQAVLAALSDPITLGGQRLDVGGSLGIALYPQDAVDATILLRGADRAMLAAKRRHAGLAFAADNAAPPVYEQLSLVGEMREALVRSEFVLHYQPKLDLVEQRVTGAEALIRWQHPQRGLLSPIHFVPFAEQTGFIREITPWLLEQAVAQAARWAQAGAPLVVSANLSTLDILNPRLLDHVRGLLAQHHLPAHLLCLEITESALMDEPALALSHLVGLAALGVKLSIDDYGSGQASLGYLKTLPVHELKIDQSFVTAVGDSPKNAAIVRSTILLSHALDLTVTAEGAETDADLAWLSANGCDLAQGYGIARPMPAQALASWVAAYPARKFATPPV